MPSRPSPYIDHRRTKNRVLAGFVDVSGRFRMLSDQVKWWSRGLFKNPRNPLIAIWYPKSRQRSCPRSCPSSFKCDATATVRILCDLAWPDRERCDLPGNWRSRPEAGCGQCRFCAYQLHIEGNDFISPPGPPLTFISVCCSIAVRPLTAGRTDPSS
jgi:hypothetical protein